MRITTTGDMLSNIGLKIPKPPGSPEQQLLVLYSSSINGVYICETAQVQRPAVFTHGMDSWQKGPGQEPVHIMLRNK